MVVFFFNLESRLAPLSRRLSRAWKKKKLTSETINHFLLSSSLAQRYGWHFPEMAKVVSDNVAYAKCVRLMGSRDAAAETDFSAVPLDEDVEAKLREAAAVSMGTEISETDLANVAALCDQVVALSEYRAQLYDYLRARMAAIAPNLTALVGELVGARLVAHAGSLLSLAKAPASTVQILGAEKALFRALKTKHDTPKYGLIYHASLIGQAPPKLKGKISRLLAAKCSLGVRVDALGDGTDATVGLDGRAKVRFDFSSWFLGREGERKREREKESREKVGGKHQKAKACAETRSHRFASPLFSLAGSQPALKREEGDPVGCCGFETGREPNFGCLVSGGGDELLASNLINDL